MVLNWEMSFGPGVGTVVPMSVSVTWAWPTPVMAQAANTKMTIRVLFFIERRMDGREGELLKFFTGFYDKMCILLVKTYHTLRQVVNVTNSKPG
jgi:hypothetical protein